MKALPHGSLFRTDTSPDGQDSVRHLQEGSLPDHLQVPETTSLEPVSKAMAIILRWDEFSMIPEQISCKIRSADRSGHPGNNMDCGNDTIASPCP